MTLKYATVENQTVSARLAARLRQISEGWTTCFWTVGGEAAFSWLC